MSTSTCTLYILDQKHGMQYYSMPFSEHDRRHQLPGNLTNPNCPTSTLAGLKFVKWIGPFFPSLGMRKRHWCATVVQPWSLITTLISRNVLWVTSKSATSDHISLELLLLATCDSSLSFGFGRTFLHNNQIQLYLTRTIYWTLFLYQKCRKHR